MDGRVVGVVEVVVGGGGGRDSPSSRGTPTAKDRPGPVAA